MTTDFSKFSVLIFFQNRYDVIGLSYYPYWLKGHPDYTLSINDLGNNLQDMSSRYNKEVMVVEVGGEDTLVQNTYDMLVAVQQKVKAVADNKGLGVIYWEPEGAFTDKRKRRELKAILEAMLFVSPEPLSLTRLVTVLGDVTKAEIEQVLRSLGDELE